MIFEVMDLDGSDLYKRIFPPPLPSQLVMAGLPVAKTLAKPFDHAELLATVREVVEGMGNPQRGRER